MMNCEICDKEIGIRGGCEHYVRQPDGQYAKPSQPPAPDDNICNWYQEGIDSDWWGTSCAQAFILNDGTPAENDFHFCPYCGKRLTETPYSEESDSL
jgi:hypothetical protein